MGERKEQETTMGDRNRRSGLEVRISKSLSYLLRHGAQKERMNIDEGGFIKLSDVLRHKTMKSANEEMVRHIVATCPKQRFYIEAREDGDYIRANQGHSMMELNVDMQEIKDPSRYPEVFQGTYLKIWPSIQKEGLKTMNRQHIHLANGRNAISGVRSSVEVLVFINLPLAIQDGIVFLVSMNQVILTKGIDGVLPPKYFLRAQSKTGELIWENKS